MDFNPNIICYFCGYIIIYIVYSWRGKCKGINTTSFFLLYYGFTGFCGFYFYNISNGLFRDFSNITAMPFVFLFSCIIISISPFYKYDKYSPHISISSKQYKFIDGLSLFLGLCALLPFLESLVKIPSSLGHSESMAEMYEARLYGVKVENYHSWVGRRFYEVISYSSLITPICLMIQLTKKKLNLKAILSLSLCFITIIMHNMISGGRSNSLQDIMYLFVVYMLYKRNFPLKIQKKVRRYGSILIGIGLAGMMAVTLSRFSALTHNNYDNVFEAMSLYSGEGPINFNNNLWSIKKTSGGYRTFGFYLGVIDGHLPTVEELWGYGDKIGIEGNIFYTWVGDFYSDFGLYSFWIILLLTSFWYFFIVNAKRTISISRFVVLALWAKVLVVGPLFFTYAPVFEQYKIGIALLCCVILNNLSFTNKKIIVTHE